MNQYYLFIASDPFSARASVSSAVLVGYDVYLDCDVIQDGYPELQHLRWMKDGKNITSKFESK